MGLSWLKKLKSKDILLSVHKIWPSLVLYCRSRTLLCLDSHGLCSSCSCCPPPHPTVLLQLTVILFHAEGEGKEETEEEWVETEKEVERRRRSAGLCPCFPPHVAVLSLQQRLSVALCVAQWLRNMCPSRRITPASEKLPNKHHSRNIFLPHSPVSFRWLMVCAELWAYSTFMMWAKPIWDSISCLPALSTLKTTTILSWGRSSELITVCSGHGQGRSLLPLRHSAMSSSESRLCYCCFFLFSNLCMFWFSRKR